MDILTELWYNFSCSLVWKTALGAGHSSSWEKQSDTQGLWQVSRVWEWNFKTVCRGRRSICGRGYVGSVGRGVGAWILGLALPPALCDLDNSIEPLALLFPVSQTRELVYIMIRPPPWLWCGLQSWTTAANIIIVCRTWVDREHLLQWLSFLPFIILEFGSQGL